MPKIFMTCVIALMTIAPSMASAHSGRTNDSGCHEKRSTGTVHCHAEDDVDGERELPEPVRRPIVPGPPIPPGDVLAAMKANVPVRPPGDGFEVVPASRVQMILVAQILLRSLGADIIDAPGELGETTILAIREFQRQRGVRPDGRVSGNLLVRLAEAVAPLVPKS